MKNKILLIVTALIILVVGCGSTAVNAKSQKSSSRFRIDYITEWNDVEEYRDTETGVHYLIYKDRHGYAGMGGICPRYNADGSLYVD